MENDKKIKRAMNIDQVECKRKNKIHSTPVSLAARSIVRGEGGRCKHVNFEGKHWHKGRFCKDCRWWIGKALSCAIYDLRGY